MHRGAKHEEEENTMAKRYIQDIQTNKCMQCKEINPYKRQVEEAKYDVM